jgi:hypothetical protein
MIHLHSLAGHCDFIPTEPLFLEAADVIALYLKTKSSIGTSEVQTA